MRTDPRPAVPATFAAKAPGRGPAIAFPTATAAGRKRRRSFGQAINAKGVAEFTRQLATLVKAGMPILRSLEVLARQSRKPAFRQVVEEIGDTIRSGGNFSDGLAAHDNIFDRRISTLSYFILQYKLITLLKPLTILFFYLSI